MAVSFTEHGRHRAHGTGNITSGTASTSVMLRRYSATVTPILHCRFASHYSSPTPSTSPRFPVPTSNHRPLKNAIPRKNTITHKNTRDSAIYRSLYAPRLLNSDLVELSSSSLGIFVFISWMWADMACGYGKWLRVCVERIFY